MRFSTFRLPTGNTYCRSRIRRRGTAHFAGGVGKLLRRQPWYQRSPYTLKAPEIATRCFIGALPTPSSVSRGSQQGPMFPRPQPGHPAHLWPVELVVCRFDLMFAFPAPSDLEPGDVTLCCPPLRMGMTFTPNSASPFTSNTAGAITRCNQLGTRVSWPGLTPNSPRRSSTENSSSHTCVMFILAVITSYKASAYFDVKAKTTARRTRPHSLESRIMSRISFEKL